MMIREAIQSLVEGRSLTMDEATQVMEEIMDGHVTPSQFGAFVTALRMKGETVEEIAGLARTMRAKAVHVAYPQPLVDTCGTGGDGASTFNVSTTAAFIVAGAGLTVAKHGNRAMSSKSGSADVLEALGIRIELTPAQVEHCLREVGIAFMFAPAFHPSMKYASAPRREIGIRTVFNVLGPLTNPAGAQAQVIGVPTEKLGSRIAQALALLGTKHALVVHGAGDLDELSIAGRSSVWELRQSIIREYSISPEDFGYQKADIGAIRGGTATDNAKILRAVLGGEKSPRRDMTVMNAAAAIMAGRAEADATADGGVEGLAVCARRAEAAIDNGTALNKLEQMIEITNSFEHEK
jgi:anthranilate phosphoribosyltransferase